MGERLHGLLGEWSKFDDSEQVDALPLRLGSQRENDRSCFVCAEGGMLVRIHVGQARGVGSQNLHKAARQTYSVTRCQEQCSLSSVWGKLDQVAWLAQGEKQE